MIKIEVTTHSGRESELLQVESYNPQETADILNGITKNEVGNTFNVITLGDNIYSCIDIKKIKKIEDEQEEEPAELIKD